jgi:alpha-mannosidase
LLWDESHKILKVEFPLLIKWDTATYETQFGHLQRPTHNNTSWDYAKFEVCGHKWIDFSEWNFGVSMLNDCKYGFSVKGNTMHMSIVRAPKAPDDKCDIGRHLFRYALLPHTGSFEATVKRAYEFNCPLVIDHCLPDKQLLSVDQENVIIDTVKLAQSSDYIVVRMYECYGGRSVVRLKSQYRITQVWTSNILEERLVQLTEPQVEFTPFQLRTLLLKLE